MSNLFVVFPVDFFLYFRILDQNSKFLLFLGMRGMLQIDEQMTDRKAKRDRMTDIRTNQINRTAYIKLEDRQDAGLFVYQAFFWFVCLPLDVGIKWTTLGYKEIFRSTKLLLTGKILRSLI